MRDHGGCDMSTPRQPPTLPTCLEIPDTCTPLRGNAQEGREGYRPAAPIQRFNNGHPGSNTSGQLPMFLAGITIRGPNSWYPTSMRQL